MKLTQGVLSSIFHFKSVGFSVLYLIEFSISTDRYGCTDFLRIGPMVFNFASYHRYHNSTAIYDIFCTLNVTFILTYNH